MRLDEQLCFALYDASRLVASAYQSALRGTGLTYTQFLVLLVLWEDEHVTMSALGARLHLDSGTLSPLVQRMERAGLLARHRDDVDGRRVTVRLTGAGRDLEPVVAEAHRCLAEGLPVPAEDLVRLRNLTQQFAAAVREPAALSPRAHRRPA